MYERKRCFNWFVVCTWWVKWNLVYSEDPPQKKARLSLKLKKKRQPLKEIENSSRFRSPVKESEYSEAAKGVIPANTKKCTYWAVRVFESWINERSVRKTEDPIPENILQCHDKAIVCKYMRYFVLKKQGTLSQMKRSLDSFNTSLDFRTAPLTSTKHLKVLNLTCFI